MPIDSAIPLQVQGPADPLERYGKVLALKNAITQNQSGNLQLQQQQMDLEDQQKMRQAFATSGGDLDKLQQNAIQLGVGPKTLMQLKDSLLKQRESLAKIGNDELAVKKDHTEAIGAAAQSLLQLPTPEARAAAYPQAISTLVAQGRIKPEEVPAQYPGDEAIQQFANVARSSQQQIDSVFKEREVKAQEQSAANSKLTAETGQKRENRESDQTAFQNAISDLSGNPAANPAEYNARIGKLPPAVASRILQAVPVGQYDPAKSVAALRSIGMTPVEQTQADQAAANEKDLNDYRKSEFSLARSKDTREQAIYDQTYGPGANPALVGVDPKLRTQASTAAQKAADEYVKAQAAQRDMQTFLDLAKAGNKEANAYISPEGVLTLNTARGVTRVNRQEIDAFAGAGSLFDQIAGKVGKLTSGQSVPPDVLKDIDALQKQISGNSGATYNQKLNGINQNYRSNFKPIEGDKTTPAAVPHVSTKAQFDALPSGAIYTEDDGKQYKKP